MRYGLLSYSTRNVGDDIQSLAARRFLPRVDVPIDRDTFEHVSQGEPFKIILNGWFTHRPENWPPPPDLIPLLVSFHLTREILRLNVSRLRASEYLLQGSALDYLRTHSPIGCRDPATAKLLEHHGVDAYFSGCLTLTLENRCSERGNATYCVDVPESIAHYVAKRVGGSVKRIAHRMAVDTMTSAEARTSHAENLLDQYATARLVVTSRLHCALPCLALGTPVIFVVETPGNYRLRGLCELTRHYTIEEVLSDHADIDWRNPEPNPISINRLRDDLIDRCSSFVQG